MKTVGVILARLQPDHKICKSSGWNNFMWGGDVRKATPDEVKAFMVKVFYSEPIKNY